MSGLKLCEHYTFWGNRCRWGCMKLVYVSSYPRQQFYVAACVCYYVCCHAWLCIEGMFLGSS